MRTILLSAPSAVSVLIASVPGSRIRSGGGGEELRQDRGAPDEQPCPADPAARSVPPITKPALGMSADYGLTPTPYTSDPDPLGKIISAAGTHYELSWIADMAFGATLHGADEVAWYTTAWFDKYVKETTQLPSTLSQNFQGATRAFSPIPLRVFPRIRDCDARRHRPVSCSDCFWRTALTPSLFRCQPLKIQPDKGGAGCRTGALDWSQRARAGRISAGSRSP